jgi:hypothetical protein
MNVHLIPVDEEDTVMIFLMLEDNITSIYCVKNLQKIRPFY